MQGRLLLVFSLIGGLPPTLIVILSLERVRVLPDASNPEAILNNLILVQGFRKFQNWHHPKNHEYDGEINETWDNYFSGTALSWQSA